MSTPPHPSVTRPAPFLLAPLPLRSLTMQERAGAPEEPDSVGRRQPPRLRCAGAGALQRCRSGPAGSTGETSPLQPPSPLQRQQADHPSERSVHATRVCKHVPHTHAHTDRFLPNALCLTDRPAEGRRRARLQVLCHSPCTLFYQRLPAGSQRAAGPA